VVTLAFSAPLDPASIAAGNFSLLAGDRALEPGIRYSADFRNVMLSSPLPPDASILVQVSDRVRDIWGRSAPAFQSEFHTASAPREANPSVIAQHPATGATSVDPGVAIHLSLDRAIDWLRAYNALSVTQNGEPVEGRIQIAQGGKDVEFVPYAPFRAGAVVRVALDSADRHEGLFTTASVDGIAEPMRAMPGGVDGAPLNAVIELEYSLPLDRTTLTPGTVTLSADSSSQPVPAAVMLRGERIVRIVPSALLSPGTGYTAAISDTVQDITGKSASPMRRSFTAGGETVSGIPRLTSTTPGDAATDVDANGEVHLLFDRPVNPLTLDAGTVRLSVDDLTVSASISLATGGSEVIVTPVAPLKDSCRVQLTISGVEDMAGNAVPSSTVSFQVRKAVQQAGAQLASNGEGPRQRSDSVRRRFFVFLIGRR
jgi:hypothetical protein